MIRRTLGLFVTLARRVLWWSLTAATPPSTMPRIGVRARASPSTSPDWKTRALVVQALRTQGRADPAARDARIDEAWREHTLDEVRHAGGMAYAPHR